MEDVSEDCVGAYDSGECVVGGGFFVRGGGGW